MSEPRILNEHESLKVEVITLRMQLLNEQKKAVDYQQAIVDLRVENLKLRTQLLEADNDKTLSEFGIVGNNKIVRLEDGKYKVEPQNGVAKG